MLEEIDEVKKKKKRIDAEVKSLNDTADELCTKAEATANICHSGECKGKT